MKDEGIKKWVTPKLEILRHTEIMGKESFNVPEQNKTGTDTSAVSNASS
ncbi:hypothetical protein HA152_07605 [Prochlorococcus marinus XMU1412]|nr:hypothetical protein [Prochlorococcus marinus]MBO8240567.1 hypothetical protein [Prochlorococcus marinus XMU1412]